MSKKNPLAFVPISNQQQIKTEIEKIDNSELGNYKDVGVEYQGYSKVKQAGNTFKLLKQEFKSNYPSFGWVASDSERSLTINSSYPELSFFITDMVMFYYKDAVGTCQFRLYNEKGDVICRLWSTGSTTIQQTSIHFDIPFKFDAQTLIIRPEDFSNNPQVITGGIVVNIYGYSEQKP